VTETWAEAERTGSIASEAVDVAVIVTVGFATGHGTLFGTLYVMLAPLALWLGAFGSPELKVPQVAVGQPVAVQSTPPGAISLVTVALKVVGTPAVIACVVSVTEIGGTIVTAAVPVFVGSAIEVAVTTTGIVEGLEDDDVLKVVSKGAKVLVVG